MYIEDILRSNNYTSGVIRLIVPEPSGAMNGNDPITYEIKGLIDGDISFKMSNAWGSIVPNMASLSEISQILNSQSILSWISSSTGAWKGTEPLTMDVSFYLVTYSRNQALPIKEAAARLARLNALYAKDRFNTVLVHGGYTLNLTDANGDGAKYFLDGENIKTENVEKLRNASKGLITAYIGDSFKIGKLLLKEVDVNPSTVQVGPNTPLYIKVNASFRTFRSLITEDVDEFFRLNGSVDDTGNDNGTAGGGAGGGGGGSW